MAKPRSQAASFRAVLRIFGLFGEPMRVVLFQRLSRHPSSAGELAKELPVSRTAIVQHLKALEREGLVAGTPDGRRRVYRIAPAALAPLSDWLKRHGAR